MEKIILPKEANSRDVYVAAAYAVAIGEENVHNIMELPKKNEHPTLYSDEVKKIIEKTFSAAFSNLISLYIQSKVCDPILDKATDTIDAVSKIAAVIKAEYVPNF